MNNKLILKYQVGNKYKTSNGTTFDLSGFQGRDEYWYEEYPGLLKIIGIPDTWSAKDHFDTYFRGEWLKGKLNGTNKYLDSDYDNIRDSIFKQYMNSNYGKTDRNITGLNEVNKVISYFPAYGLILSIFTTPLRNLYRKNQTDPITGKKEKWIYDSNSTANGEWYNVGEYDSGKYWNGELHINNTKLKQNQLTKSHKQQLKLNKYTPLIVNKLGGILFGRKGFKVIDGQLNIIADSGSYLPILLGENGGYKYIWSDGKEHYFNTFTPWDKAQLHKIGYTVDNNKIIKLQNTGNKTQSVAPVDTSNPVLPNTSTSFTPEQFLLALLGNDEYIKRFKQLLGIQENQVKPDETIKPEPETTKPEESKNGNTYESLVQANTAAFNNGINSAYWRKNFRKSFNNALLSGNMYGVDENGTQVFDINGITASDIIGNYGIFDSLKGLTRRGMRLLMKLQKFNNAGIFANAQLKVKSLNASPAQTNKDVVDAYEPNYGVKMIGSTTPILGPTMPTNEDEPDVQIPNEYLTSKIGSSQYRYVNDNTIENPVFNRNPYVI